MQELEKKLNYTFRDPSELAEALSHSSSANQHRWSSWEIPCWAL